MQLCYDDVKSKNRNERLSAHWEFCCCIERMIEKDNYLSKHESCILIEHSIFSSFL